MIRTSTMVGNNAKPMAGATALGANRTRSLDSNGFTVGNHATVNSDTVTYFWVAFKASPGGMKVGSYTGSEDPNTWDFGDGTSQSYITSLDGDEFSVYTSSTVNASGTRYHYIAWNETSGSMDVGSDTGNGADNRGITGVGFQPEYVVVKGLTTSGGRWTSHRPDSTGASTDNGPQVRCDHVGHRWDPGARARRL